MKNNSGLHIHQILNKRIGLMKRESGRSLTHHFSFGERFDEKMLRVHFFGGQRVILFIHQFIGFSPPQQVRRESNCGKHRHPQAGRTDFHPADRQGKALIADEKKKATDITADTAAGFWKTKSHSSLGRFLHAPLRPC